MAIDGVKDCPYYIAKVGEIDHRCCGGRITKYAIVNCLKRGRVNARDDCKPSCGFCTATRTKSMMPSTSEDIPTINTDEMAANVWDKIMAPVTKDSGDNIVQSVNAISESETHEPPLPNIYDDPDKSIWQKWSEELKAKKKQSQQQNHKPQNATRPPIMDWKNFQK